MSPGCPHDDGLGQRCSTDGNPHVVETAADVRRLLAAQMMQLRANPDLDPLQKAGRLAQLGQVILRAIELDTLEMRVQALEATLRLRKVDQTVKETSP